MSHAGVNKGRSVQRKLSIICFHRPSFAAHCFLVIKIVTTWKLLKFTCSSLGKMMLSTPWCSTCLKAYHLKYDLSSSLLPIKYKLPCPLMFTPVPWCLKAITWPPGFVVCHAGLIFTSLTICGCQHPSFTCTLASEQVPSPSPFWKHIRKHFFSYCLASWNF